MVDECWRYSKPKQCHFWAWLKRPIFGVHDSQGSAETLVRRGGITNYHLIAYSFSNISAKNYQNQLMCIEVIVCNVTVVFLKHSVDLVYKSIIASPSIWTTNCPWKGRGLARVTHFWKKKLRHDTPLIEINNVVDDRPLFITPQTVDAIQGLRLKLQLSLHLLQTWLYNISTTNRPSGVWALSIKYVLITDISRSV